MKSISGFRWMNDGDATRSLGLNRAITYASMMAGDKVDSRDIVSYMYRNVRVIYVHGCVPPIKCNTPSCNTAAADRSNHCLACLERDRAEVDRKLNGGVSPYALDENKS